MSTLTSGKQFAQVMSIQRQAGWNCQALELGGGGPHMPAGLVLGEAGQQQSYVSARVGVSGARQPSSSCFCFTDEERGREAK